MKNNNTKVLSRKQPDDIDGIKDLIIALFEHPATPEWLLDVMWEEINNHACINAYDSDNLRVMMKFTNWSGKRERFN